MTINLCLSSQIIVDNFDPLSKNRRKNTGLTNGESLNFYFHISLPGPRRPALSVLRDRRDVWRRRQRLWCPARRSFWHRLARRRGVIGGAVHVRRRVTVVGWLAAEGGEMCFGDLICLVSNIFQYIIRFCLFYKHFPMDYSFLIILLLQIYFFNHFYW